jgi:hypothetical protein
MNKGGKELRGIVFNKKKFIDYKNLPEVISPYKNVPGGLLDPNIFGVTDIERDENMGYVDLGGKYIHGIYLSGFKRGWKLLYQCATTNDTFCKIDENKILVKAESTDPDAGNGINWIYENWDRIDKSKLTDIDTGRLANIRMRKSLGKLSRDKLFTSYQIILPLGYREEEPEGIIADEINKLLSSLIAMANMKKNGNNDLIDKDSLSISIQLKLMSIWETYFVDKFGSSHGDIQKSVLSRVVNNSGRSVIVPPEYRSKYIGKEAIGLNTSGYPIEHVMNYFSEFTIFGSLKLMEYLYDLGLFKEMPRAFLRYYDSEKIKDIMKMFYKDTFTRVSPVMIPAYDDKPAEPLKINIKVQTSENNFEMVEKELSWLEFFYIALKEFAYIDDKHTSNTRFPTTSEKSSKVQRIHLLTLNQYDLTKTVDVLGFHYDDFYPYVDENIKAQYNKKIFEVGCKISPMVSVSMDGDFDSILNSL